MPITILPQFQFDINMKIGIGISVPKKQFKQTIDNKPIVTLAYLSNVTDVSAIVGAMLDCKGLTTTWSIEYGSTSSYGLILAGGVTSANGTKTVSLTGLAQSSTVHWRFKAINADGTTYSNDQVINLNYVSSNYNLSGSLAYTVINKSLATIGDWLEIKARGLSTNYASDLTYLANPNVAYNRFAWYSATQMQLRITGQTTVYWTVTGVDVNKMNVYKLVRVTGGYELFVNGVSKGTVTNAGTFVFYSLGGSSISSGTGKWEIEYAKTSISSVETTFSNLYQHANSTNVVKNEYNLYDTSKIYVIKQTNPVTNVTERLNVYLQLDKERFMHYLIDHESNVSTYVNYWRITKSMIAFRTFSNSSFIDSLIMNLNTGENEFTLIQSGLDFVGGYHGNERIDIQAGDGITFYLDDVIKTISDFSTSTYSTASKFKFVVNSSIHRYSDAAHTILATHAKITEIKGKGYITDSSVTIKNSEELTVYYGIACIGKDTAQYCANENLQYQLFVSDSQNKFVTNNPPLREMYGYNSTTRLNSFVTSKLFDATDDTQGECLIADRALDSKYYRKSTKATYALNKVFHSEMKVEFSVY